MSIIKPLSPSVRRRFAVAALATSVIAVLAPVANAGECPADQRVADGQGQKPGDIVPWHSHNERPAMIYIVSGEVVEYASNCVVPILHKAGDVEPEKNGTSHWWKNTGNTPAVLISVDLFPAEIKMDPHEM